MAKTCKRIDLKVRSRRTEDGLTTIEFDREALRKATLADVLHSASCDGSCQDSVDERLIRAQRAVRMLHGALRHQIEQWGVEHYDDCPEDDTCDCPIVRQINEALTAGDEVLEES